MKDPVNFQSKIFEELYLFSNSNKSIATIFNSISESIIITDLEHKIILCNNVTAKIFNYETENNIVGMNFKELISNADIKKLNVCLNDTLEKGFVEGIKFHCLRKDRTQFTSEISFSSIKNADGEIIGHMSIINDRSEIASVNEQLRLLITALESAANSIFITDKNGEIMWVNSSFNLLSGYSDNELLGKTPKMLKSGLHDKDFYEKMWKTITSGTIWHGEVINKKKNGNIYYEDMTITPIKNEFGEIANYIAIVQDISEKKNAEDEVNFLANALKSISEIVVVTDIENKIIFVNEALESSTGYFRSELLGLNIDMFFPAGISSKVVEHFMDTDFSEVWKGEVNINRKDGLQIPAILYCSTMNDRKGKVIGLVYAATDISRRKIAEKKLYESERKYRSLFENATIGMYRASNDGKILMANSQLLKILGYNAIDSLNEVNIDIDCYVDINQRKEIKRILQTEGVIHGYESKWRKPDGSIIILKESAIAFWDHEGKLNHYEGTIEDITDKIAAEKEAEKRFEILKALRFTSETFLKTTNWNSHLDQVLKMLGKSVELSNLSIFQKVNSTESGNTWELISKWKNKLSKSKSEFNSNELNQIKINKLRQLEMELLSNKIINSVESRNSIVKQEFLDMLKIKSILIIPICIDDTLWGVIETHDNNNVRVWDQTEIETLRSAADAMSALIQRRNYELQLIEAKKEAEKSDKLKSEFLAQVSHEIRTPLHSISSFTSLIKDSISDRMDDDLSTSFQIIQQSSSRLIRTIGLIVNMSEIQTNNFVLNKRVIDLHSEIIEKLYAENLLRAKTGHIKFSINNSASNTLIEADKYSVEQIFNNIIDNALKFTIGGRVDISIVNDDEKSVCVKISDNGIGISPDYLPRMFEPFSQEEQGYTRSFDGNGLGLSLVKKYCDLNNAQINVESKKGKGSIFTVKFNLNGKEEN